MSNATVTERDTRFDAALMRLGRADHNAALADEALQLAAGKAGGDTTALANASERLEDARVALGEAERLIREFVARVPAG